MEAAVLGYPASALEVKGFSHKAYKILKSLSKLIDSRSFINVLVGKMNRQWGNTEKGRRRRLRCL